jgi:hypothetical protein
MTNVPNDEKEGKLRKNEFWGIKAMSDNEIVEVDSLRSVAVDKCQDGFKVIKVRVVESGAVCEWKEHKYFFKSGCSRVSALHSADWKHCPFCALPIKEGKEKKG